MNNYYNYEELKQIGFKSLGGNDILISKKTSIFRPERISIGNHVRIDDFCLLSGEITFGNYIHIASYSAFFGGSSSIIMDDFSGLAYRCTVVAESDDYSGEHLTNPTIAMEYRSISSGPVHFGKHVVLGAGSLVLPGVFLGEGCAFGAMTLVNKSTEPWGIYMGVPCKRIKERNKELLNQEKQFILKFGG